MGTVRSTISAIITLAAIVYCGWLFFYFFNQVGSVEEAEAEGLGPTLLGLAIVGLIFCVVFVVQIIRILRKLHPRASGSGGPGTSTGTSEADETSDADATIARYLAARAAGTATPSPSPGTAPDKPESAGGAGFGRRGR